jgi:hypothetical protein
VLATPRVITKMFFCQDRPTQPRTTRVESVMGNPLAWTIQRKLERVNGRLKGSMKQWRVCRSCGGLVAPFDSVCGHCGVGSPVKVSGLQSFYVAMISAEAILLLIWLT